jgi:4-amino-4-deoxy-L-arabinose transferase-like glycosyltransferase
MTAFSVWARKIAAGDWLCRDTYHPNMNWMPRVAPLEQFEAWWGGKEVYHQTPLYPYVLAVSYRLFDSATPMLWLQVLCSSLSLILVFELGRRLLDERTGLIAAGLVAVFPPSIVLDAFLLRSSLNASITLLSIWLLLRVREGGGRATAGGTGTRR